MKNLVRVIIKSFIGLLFLILLVSIANLLPIENIYFLSILEFINANILIIILFTILFFLGEIFYLFNFPLSLPGPIFYAYGGYFLASFIFKIFYVIDYLTGKEILSIFKYAEPITLFLVFILILVFGILKILVKKDKKDGLKKEEREISWSDVGKEFKGGIYNLVIRFRQFTKLKEKTKKKLRIKKND